MALDQTGTLPARRLFDQAGATAEAGAGDVAVESFTTRLRVWSPSIGSGD
jgi:hypothetical protein